MLFASKFLPHNHKTLQTMLILRLSQILAFVSPLNDEDVKVSASDPTTYYKIAKWTL